MIKNGKQTLVHVSIKRYVAIEAGNNTKTQEQHKLILIIQIKALGNKLQYGSRKQQEELREQEAF